MIYLTTLLLLSAPAGQLPPLPISPAEPLLSYMSCLMEPAAATVRAGLPARRAEREAAVEGILSDCASVRSSAASAAFERSETLPAMADQARRDLIEAYLQHFERGMRHMIVDFEQFAAESDAYEACLEQGGPEC